MQKSLSYVLWLLVISLTVLVVWNVPLSLGDRTRVRVAIEETYLARDVLSDEGMLLFQHSIAQSIVRDGEWIRSNLPQNPEEYYEKCLALEYKTDPDDDPWQTPSETETRRGGDCEDLTTYQLAFGMILGQETYKIGFIVIYPEVVEKGAGQGHIAAVVHRIDTGVTFVWDLSYGGMRYPVEIDHYLYQYHLSELAGEPKNVSKYYRLWWLFEMNPDLQPEMQIMPDFGIPSTGKSIGIPKDSKDYDYPWLKPPFYIVQFDSYCIQYKGQWVTYLYLENDPTHNMSPGGSFVKIIFSPDDVWYIPRHRILYIRKILKRLTDEERTPFGLL